MPGTRVAHHTYLESAELREGEIVVHAHSYAHHGVARACRQLEVLQGSVHKVLEKNKTVERT